MNSKSDSILLLKIMVLFTALVSVSLYIIGWSYLKGYFIGLDIPANLMAYNKYYISTQGFISALQIVFVDPIITLCFYSYINNSYID